MNRKTMPTLLALAASAIALAGCATTTSADEAAAAAGRDSVAAATATNAAPQIDVAMMKEMVRTLSSDEFEGRAPSTPAEPKTLDYIVAKFTEAGLQPGNKGSWLQEVPMVGITASAHTPLKVTGGKAPMSFSFGDQYVAASYRVTPQTRITNSDLVFVGYGINAPELGWNDYAGLDMKGKTAIILVNDPDYETATEDGLFKGRRMTYYGRWTYKFEEAARQGAAGALIVHDTFPAAYGWNVVNSSWTGEQYYVQTANDGADQTAANGWVQKDVAEKILAAAGKDLATLTAAAKQKGFKPVPLNLKATFGFDNAIKKSMSHNVVGLLPGNTRPDEYVLYSGHWDHLGRCTPDATGDDICNGAVDNATGIAALAAIAKAEKAAGGAERSQVFLAVTLEESGLLGSEYYAQNPVFPLDQTVGGVNMDALAPSGRARDYAIIGGDKSDLTALARQSIAAKGLVETPEASSEKGHYYRSDHFSFAKKGVPMFNVSRGRDLVEGGTAAGAAVAEDYTVNRYHQPADEYSEDWNWDGIVQDVEMYYTLGRLLADSDQWPNWNADDEFRAIRDKACAASATGC